MKKTQIQRKPSTLVRKPIKRTPGSLKTAPGGPKKRKKPTDTAKLKKQLWELCKGIVRKRYALPDGTWKCYTCDLHITNPKDAHTAHFVARSLSGTELKYSLENLRVCCGNCNVWKSGNWPAYYERMVLEVGLENVNRIIASRHELTKTGLFFYERKVNEYKALLEKE